MAVWAAAALLVALALAAGFRWLDRRRAEQAAHPRVEGSLPIVGLRAPVGVVRDRNGVPHVRGQTESDAWLALGFVHAQDRLAQMLELRRAAQGRSAEVVGRSALPADRWARTLGLARLAASDLERAPRDVRQVLDAYARGVNARIARVRSGLAGPPLALSEDPETLEDWVPADSLALLKLQAWVLGNSVEASLVLETLIQKFGGLGARPFFPDGVGFRAVPPEPERTLASRRSGLDGGLPLRAQLGFAGRSIGSTAFAVSGALAARGGILLGADQHLEARAPAHLYEAHLRGGELDVAGATLPGIPVFWTGFTPDVVWASTHYPALVSDLFLESLKDEAPRRHWDRGGWRLLEVREEEIRVAGGASEILEVELTRRGPLVHHLLGDARPLSIRWTGALGIDGLGGLLGMCRARDVDDVHAALARHREPVLLTVFADREGRGGSRLAGYLPLRSLPSGGLPAPALNAAHVWREPMPSDVLPRQALGRDVPWVIAADGRLSSEGRARGIEVLWRAGERESRLREKLGQATPAEPLDVAALVEIQRDVYSDSAAELLRLALAFAGPLEKLPHEAREVARLLTAWDRNAAPDSIGAAVYHVFRRRLVRSLFEQRMGEPLLARYLALRGVSAAQLALRVLRAAEAGGGDPGGWSEPAKVREAARRSLRETWIELLAELGVNRDKWTWGRLHRLRFHPLAPGAWGAAAERLGPLPYGGDGASLQVAEYRGLSSFAPLVVASYRFVADASNLDQALTSLAPGQSEHPGNRHSVDGLGRWLEGRPSLLSTSIPVIEDGDVARLTLQPLEPVTQP